MQLLALSLLIIAVHAFTLGDATAETAVAMGWASDSWEITVARDQPDKATAESTALNECESRFSFCKIVQEFSARSCGAIAFSGTKKDYGFGFGSDINNANSQALSNCHRSFTQFPETCSVSFSHCDNYSPPVRTQKSIPSSTSISPVALPARSTMTLTEKFIDIFSDIFDRLRALPNDILTPIATGRQYFADPFFWTTCILLAVFVVMHLRRRPNKAPSVPPASYADLYPQSAPSGLIQPPKTDNPNATTNRPSTSSALPSRPPISFEISGGAIKGLGISALVSALLAIIVPVYGIWVAALAILFAVVTALAGDRVYSTVTPIICAINIYFLSPAVWIMYYGVKDRGVMVFSILLILVAPFIAMMLNASGAVVVHRK